MALMIGRLGHPVPEVTSAQDRPDAGHDSVDQPGAGSRPVGRSKAEGGHRVDCVDPDSHGQHLGAGLETGQYCLGEMTSTKDPRDSNTLGVHSNVTQMHQDRARPQQKCDAPSGADQLYRPGSLLIYERTAEYGIWWWATRLAGVVSGVMAAPAPGWAWRCNGVRTRRQHAHTARTRAGPRPGTGGSL